MSDRGKVRDPVPYWILIIALIPGGVVFVWCRNQGLTEQEALVLGMVASAIACLILADIWRRFRPKKE